MGTPTIFDIDTFFDFFFFFFFGPPKSPTPTPNPKKKNLGFWVFGFLGLGLGSEKVPFWQFFESEAPELRKRKAVQ
jgi:hypothetical protein